MQLVAAPVLLMAPAGHFASDGAVARKFFQHLVELHGALPVQSRIELCGTARRFASFVAFGRTEFGPLEALLRFPLRYLLLRRFLLKLLPGERERLARLDGRCIT